MNNQKGFILPVTLMVAFILCSFVTFQVHQFIIEKQFYFEDREVYRADRLLQMAIVDLTHLLIDDGITVHLGKFQYEEGEVLYVVKKETEEAYSFTLTSKTIQLRSKQIKYYYYQDDGTVLPWLKER